MKKREYTITINMKTHFIIALSLLLLNGPRISSQEYAGHVKLFNRQLVVRNDSLHIDFCVRIQKKAVRTQQIVVISPELSGENRSYLLPYLRIQGQNRKKAERRSKACRSSHNRTEMPYAIINVKHDTDTLIRYQTALQYEPWMLESHLTFHQETNDGANRLRLFSFATEQSVDIYLPDPYTVKPSFAYATPAPEVKNRKKQEQAFLDFKVNSSVLLPTFRRNTEELAKIQANVCDLVNNPDIVINHLYIEGYASPEGRTAANNLLAGNRAQALSHYIVNKGCLRQQKITVTNGGEDWDGLRELIQISDLPNKDELTQLITHTTDVERRKSRLVSVAGAKAYNRLLTELYPRLRRVDYRIDYTVKDYSVQEAKALVGVKDDQLSQREFFQAAVSYGMESEQWREIISERVLKYFDKDPVALNNAAVVFALRGELATAKRYLDNISELAQAWNNLGALLLLEGDYVQARKLLNKAKEQGVKEAEENLYELEAKLQDDEIRRKYSKN